MIVRKIIKLGNSLAITFPVKYLKYLGMYKGSLVAISITGNEVHIKPVEGQTLGTKADRIRRPRRTYVQR